MRIAQVSIVVIKCVEVRIRVDVVVVRVVCESGMGLRNAAARVLHETTGHVLRRGRDGHHLLYLTLHAIDHLLIDLQVHGYGRGGLRRVRGRDLTRGGVAVLLLRVDELFRQRGHDLRVECQRF